MKISMYLMILAQLTFLQKDFQKLHQSNQVKNLMDQIETFQNEIPGNPVEVIALLKEKNSEIIWQRNRIF